MQTKSNRRTEHILHIAAAAFLVAACAASGRGTAAPSPAAEFAAAWKGALAGECYYITNRLLSGNFYGGGGEELAAIDEDGFGHIILWMGRQLVEGWITTEPVAEKPIEKALAADLKGNGGDTVVLLLSGGIINIWGSEKDSFEMLCRDCLSDLRKQYRIFSIAAADVDDDYKKEIVALAESKDHIYLLTFEWQKNKLDFFSGYPLALSSKPADIIASSTPAGDDCYLYMVGGKPKYRLIKLDFNEEGVSTGRILKLDENHKRIVSIWTGGLEQNNKNALILLEARAGLLSLRAIDTSSGELLFRIPAAPPETRHAVTAGLNTDEKTEFVFSEVGCKYNIFSEVTRPSGAGKKQNQHGHDDNNGSKTGEK
jgi:hypothetical protein